MFFRRSRIGVLFLFFLTGCTGVSTWTSVVDHHRRVYPQMEIDDVYKLVFQGTLGAEHALHDTMAAKKYLFEEYRNVDTTEFREEPLMEYLSADSCFIRIHLRPFKRRGGDIQALWSVVVSGAQVVKPKSVFISQWNSVCGKLSKPPFSWTPKVIEEFKRKVENLRYPAMHHSVTYTKAYKPAYRVVLKSEFDKLNLH